MSRRLEYYLMAQHGSAYCLQRFKNKVQEFKTKRDHKRLIKSSSINISILFRAILAQKRDSGAVWSWGYGRNGQLGHGSREDSLQPRLIKHFQNNEVIMVSAADSHSVALDEDGVVYQWGDGLVTVTPRGEEELMLCPGIVSTDMIDRMSKVGGIAVKVSAGECHAAILTENGLLFTWGLGLRGCLGHNDEFNRKSPCVVLDFEESDARVVDVHAGPMCTACIDIHGEVYVWGCGMHGKLGNGGTAGSLKPQVLAELRAEVKDEHSKVFGRNACHVTIGKYHGVCVMDGGEVLTWGTENRGCLAGAENLVTLAATRPAITNGPATSDRDSSSDEDDFQSSLRPVEEQQRILPPQLVPSLHASGVLVVKAFAAPFHTVAVTKEGELYSWGKGRYGVLGHGDQADRSVPEKIACEGMDSPVLDVSVGDGFTVALTDDGRLWSWGRGQFGCLGHGKSSKKPKAKPTAAEKQPKPQKVTVVRAKAQPDKKSGKGGVTKKGGKGGKGNAAHKHVRHKDQPKPLEVGMKKHQGALSSVAAGSYHCMCTQRAGQLQEYIELLGCNVEGCELLAVLHRHAVALEQQTMAYVIEETLAKERVDKAAAAAAAEEAAKAEAETAEAGAALEGGIPAHLLAGIA
jgi:alpha-tubulin suppressor-like RCC1 family protein